MSALFKLELVDVSLYPALNNLVRVRQANGRDFQKTLRIIMKYWVDFATAKIPKGDKGKIESNLMQLSRRANAAKNSYKRTSVTGELPKRQLRRDKYGGTVAAAVVLRTGYGGAYNRMAPGAFYALVDKFVKARKFAAGVHRAGNRAAYKSLRAKLPSAMPDYRSRSPGSYRENWTDDLADMMLDNWASAWSPGSLGVGGMWPAAFSSALPEVERMMRIFLARDILKGAKQAGFQTQALPP